MRPRPHFPRARARRWCASGPIAGEATKFSAFRIVALPASEPTSPLEGAEAKTHLRFKGPILRMAQACGCLPLSISPSADLGSWRPSCFFPRAMRQGQHDSTRTRWDKSGPGIFCLGHAFVPAAGFRHRTCPAVGPTPSAGTCQPCGCSGGRISGHPHLFWKDAACA